MKLAREMERRLERLVDGISATVFRGKMHPVDFANRLLRAVDLAVVDGPLGPQIDNHLRVGVHPGEIEDGLSLAALEGELAAAVTDLVLQRGIRTGGAIVVSIEPDPTVRSGLIEVRASHVDAPLEPWAQLISPTGRNVLEIADNRALIGRGEEADVVINHGEISRRHAIVIRTAGRAFLQDLRSANGTYLNGVRLGEAPAPIVPGDQIALGPATFSFRQL